MFKRACAWVLVAALPLSACAAADRWQLPVAVKTLDNGLTVVVSEDHSSPTVGVSVVYHVGMRLEPKGRTGFAHLFEHLMFQGTPEAPKGVFDRVISSGGGFNNGSTRGDYTNYIETAPVSALEPILWLEADRMKTLDFSAENLKNQQDVVKEEIRVNVQNRPYGLFFWDGLNAIAFSKWENSHDGYGSFTDLENAKLEDVRAFHRDFYGPNNAVIAIAGDVEAEAVFALVEKYFGGIAKRPVPPRADVDEPLNAQEKRERQTDALAQVPAFAAGWKMPARGSADHAPMAVLAQLLVGDTASRLYQGLVKGREQLLNVEGGLNWPLGDAWDYDGPTLFVLFGLYKPNASMDAILSAIDEEVARVAGNGIDAAGLSRVKTRMIADYYNGLDAFISRADALAKAQVLWGDANAVNRVPGWIDAVTTDDVKRVAAKYLVAANRVAIDRVPVAAATATDPQ
ncbi:MAG TPA: pitrilysin family protein [Dokdonella sp.]|uniref:M16 family metallopeptidase n=1 Tax=Dokdonella sp. TaxID=2291710 RepID=UPI0025C58BB9|nr:pitrilysin family protein [Dokdonella sp.]MBX3691967.1 insulinase family protein [Dokdonella sp.]MCW5568356.1 insulinase family protein [Dokdonella sp.]HNR92723.1 pitrilysin family protein [Dokdonella sp.]